MDAAGRPGPGGGERDELCRAGLLAAAGLALTMIGAIATHVRLGEANRIAVPAVLLVVALFVAVSVPGQ